MQQTASHREHGEHQQSVSLIHFSRESAQLIFLLKIKRCRIVSVPEGGVAVVQYTITTRVDGDVLKVFGSYCSEVGFIKVPRNNKRCIWVRGFLLAYIPVQFPECLVCVGLRGMYTAVIMIAVNSLGSQNGRHRSI